MRVPYCEVFLCLRKVEQEGGTKKPSGKRLGPGWDRHTALMHKAENPKVLGFEISHIQP
jgi:hypothetical protein